jgi:hypothetical protein
MHARGGQGIKVRSLDERVAGEPRQVCWMLVRHDQQDIWARGHDEMDSAAAANLKE